MSDILYTVTFAPLTPIMTGVGIILYVAWKLLRVSRQNEEVQELIERTARNWLPDDKPKHHSVEALKHPVAFDIGDDGELIEIYAEDEELADDNP